MADADKTALCLYEGVTEDDSRDNIEFLWHPETTDGTSTVLSCWATQHRSTGDGDDTPTPELSIVYLNHAQARQLFCWLGAWLHKSVG